MRLSVFEDAITKADAKYFRDQNFISEDMYQRVLNWLNGAEDSEAQSMAVSWMKKDAEWASTVEPKALAQFWYVSPVVKLEIHIIRGILLSRIKELEGGTEPQKGISQFLPMSPLDGPPLPRLFNIRWKK